MAKKKTKRKSTLARLYDWWRDREPEQRRCFMRRGAWTGGVLALAIAAAVGMKILEADVLADWRTEPVRAVNVHFEGFPEWAPKSLLVDVAEAVGPPRGTYRDAEMAAEVFRRAEKNPWIRRVHSVERGRTGAADVGLIEVRAEFRMPIAQAGRDGQYFFIDVDGVRLPGKLVPRYVATLPPADGKPQRKAYYADRRRIPSGVKVRRIPYVTIEGVRAVAPTVGEKWPGRDLADGIRLVQIVRSHAWGRQVTQIDVSNHGRRRYPDDPERPQLLVIAQVSRGGATEIRFGRFAHPDGDHNISEARKMSYLDGYAAEHDGRVAGTHRWLDLRYDQLHVSTD